MTTYFCEECQKSGRSTRICKQTAGDEYPVWCVEPDYARCHGYPAIWRRL